MGHKPRTQAKNACKVDASLYRCSHCSKLIYEGTSSRNYTKLQEKWNEPIDMDKFHMDHIEPVVDPLEGRRDWNTYIERLFCGPENFQGLCPGCHALKTEEENKLRNK